MTEEKIKRMLDACFLAKESVISPGAARWSKAGIYTVYGYNSQIAGKWSAEGQDF